MAGTLLEREGELDALVAALDAAARGDGALVLIEGAAGVGKTSLLRAAQQHAQESSMQMLRARGTPLESSMPFGVVRQLFERAVTRGDRRRLLSGPAAPAAAVLGGTSLDAGGPDEELELLHGLYWLAANLGDDHPLLIAVDDLHWADVPSLRFLAYLSQRLDELRVVVVAATRTGEPGAPSELLAELAAVASQLLLRPGPLSAGAVAAIVRSREPAATDAFCQACAETTAGNPFLLRDLLDAISADGLAPTEASVARLAESGSSSLSRRTLARVERLGAGPPALARAVAVLGDDAELRHAAALAGLELDEAAEAAGVLARAGLLRPGEPLAFEHPLLEAAIRDAIPAPERGEAHRRAATRLREDGAPLDQVAAHLLNATRAGDPLTVATLSDAADEAASAGAGQAAVRYLRRALEEPPPAEDRPRLMVKLGEAEAILGDPGAVERLNAALELLSEPRERAEAHHRIGWTLYRMGNLMAAGEAFKRGVDEYAGETDDDLAAELRTAYLGVGSLCGLVELETLDHAALGSAEADPTTPGEREVLTQMAVAGLFSCQDHERTAELARRALGEGAMLAHGGVSLTFSIAVGVLLWSDALDDAESELEAGVEYALDHEAPVTAAYVRFGRAWPRFWRGHVQEAAADLRDTWEVWRGGWSVTLPSCGYWLTRCLIEMGQLDEAAALTLPPDRLGMGEPEIASWVCSRAMVQLAAGDPAAALEAMQPVTAMKPATPIGHNPAVLPWRSTMALALSGLGHRDEARHYASWEVDQARAFGAPRTLGTALRAQALVEGGDHGLALLEESAQVLELSPATLERARTLVDLGAFLRRAGRRREAREPLRVALDLLRDASAVVLRERAQDELLAAGGRPRREALSGIDSLTPSERRVAELAASGRSNPDLARELFITRKTVEYHLSAVYRKLEISSRDDLRDVLAASGSAAG